MLIRLITTLHHNVNFVNRSASTSFNVVEKDREVEDSYFQSFLFKPTNLATSNEQTAEAVRNVSYSLCVFTSETHFSLK